MPDHIQDLLGGWGMPEIAFYGLPKMPPVQQAWVLCTSCHKRFIALFPLKWSGKALQDLKCTSCGKMTCNVDKGRVG